MKDRLPYCCHAWCIHCQAITEHTRRPNGEPGTCRGCGDRWRPSIEDPRPDQLEQTGREERV